MLEFKNFTNGSHGKTRARANDSLNAQVKSKPPQYSKSFFYRPTLETSEIWANLMVRRWCGGWDPRLILPVEICLRYARREFEAFPGYTKPSSGQPSISGVTFKNVSRRCWVQIPSSATLRIEVFFANLLSLERSY